jgi:hypothetical protein
VHRAAAPAGLVGVAECCGDILRDHSATPRSVVLPVFW